MISIASLVPSNKLCCVICAILLSFILLPSGLTQTGPQNGPINADEQHLLASKIPSVSAHLDSDDPDKDYVQVFKDSDGRIIGTVAAGATPVEPISSPTSKTLEDVEEWGSEIDVIPRDHSLI
eukprot:gene29982-36216_t